jgi:alcohol dehydrogenase class IV
MVPHGMSVSLTAPEAFRWTFGTAPERHVAIARLLAPSLEAPDDAADHLPLAISTLMRDIGMPNGIGEVGYGEDDVPGLVEGALKQQRLLNAAPRPVEADDLAAIFSRSVQLW